MEKLYQIKRFFVDLWRLMAGRPLLGYEHRRKLTNTLRSDQEI